MDNVFLMNENTTNYISKRFEIIAATFKSTGTDLKKFLEGNDPEKTEIIAEALNRQGVNYRATLKKTDALLAKPRFHVTFNESYDVIRDGEEPDRMHTVIVDGTPCILKRDWFYCVSDGPTPFGAQILQTIEEDSVAYQTLEIDPYNAHYDQEILATVRQDLGLDTYFYLSKKDTDKLEFVNAICKQLLTTSPEKKGAPPKEPVNKIDFPLDKVNSNVWQLFEDIKEDDQGQLMFSLNIDTTPKRKNKRPLNNTTVFYSINFTELKGVEITKRLTIFDKFVYSVVSALYDNGWTDISCFQIYKTLGYTGKPGPSDYKKIHESLTKMRGATVYIDSRDEAKAIKGKGYGKGFVYDDSLLPFRRLTKYNDWDEAGDFVIQLHATPPLMEFARSRSQITSYPKSILEAPISKTDANLRLQDYLLERMAHIKSGRAETNKLLYSTIFAKCGIKTAKQKKRSMEKIQILLQHFIKCDQIKGFSASEDGVTMYTTDTQIKEAETHKITVSKKSE